MPKGNKDDDFGDLARLSESSAVQFGRKIIENFTHGANPQFKYEQVLENMEDNKLKSVNLISNPVLVRWKLKQEDGHEDEVHLSGHLNATLKFGQLKKTSELKIN